MNIAESIVADFEREAVFTRRLLEAVPEEQLDWKPHEKSMSLAQLAGHLAENPSWTAPVLEDSMDFADMGDYQPFVPATKAELLETAEKNRAAFGAVLAGKDDDQMLGIWKMLKGGQLLMEQPRREVIRDIILHHAAHHRGQLTVYLRLLGVAVPKTYGPTADDTEF